MQNKKKLRCFLEKFTQLTKILHDRRSRRSRQISSLSHHHDHPGKYDAGTRVNVKNLADSNKRISEVLEEEFEDGGCLADYDKNEVKRC